MIQNQDFTRQWEELTFTNDFIFSRVMRDENICRQVVELILGVKIGQIQYLSAQDEHKLDPDTMRIIMDVYLKDEQRIINVEMQTSHKKDLPKRSRYYQSVSDVSNTPSGTKYRQLPDNILIFICTFDPFDKGYSRYTFEYTCVESQHQLRLQDGSIRIFLNTKATSLSHLDEKLQAFYHYVQEGVVNSDLTEAIEHKIHSLKADSIERRTYMTLALKIADIQYDAYEEGWEEGHKDGIAAGLEQGREKGLEQGLKEGLEQGREQGLKKGAYNKTVEMAQKLLAMGLSLEQIEQVTELPRETILQLQDSSSS
ncbi:MAG: Rpn family recombination-promoting nuclease/putative transposase [Spirochaetaceae bacterium]|nr:Rpn family recombination-promoting nuclease/putative transposase [Spirochaetaceae bacterium]